ncbi:DUF6286 domain-containing protein [Streptomyces lydicamycinicus]|uniref:DUF6286 domain-containing protein n=1 Tax=Streptomyces lydicamycinicus TaxID=1546107 RepID=UPI003C2DDED2
MTSRTPHAPPGQDGDLPRSQPATTHARPAGPAHHSVRAKDRSRRPWSARRIPAALTAALVLLTAGALLFEAIWIRTGHRATAWWTTLTDELATRPLGNIWILTGAAVTAALGLWFIILALTPGLRHQLPLHVSTDGHGRIRAVLERKGAALLLRDAAMRVPGVSTARVRMRRRRVTVLAGVGFRDTADVKDDLTDTLRREERDQLALARPPQLRVRVRRSTK